MSDRARRASGLPVDKVLKANLLKSAVVQEANSVREGASVQEVLSPEQGTQFGSLSEDALMYPLDQDPAQPARSRDVYDLPDGVAFVRGKWRYFASDDFLTIVGVSPANILRMEPRDIAPRLYGRGAGKGLEVDIEQLELNIHTPGLSCGRAMFNCFRVKGGDGLYESDEALELRDLSEQKPKKPRLKKAKWKPIAPEKPLEMHEGVIRLPPVGPERPTERYENAAKLPRQGYPDSPQDRQCRFLEIGSTALNAHPNTLNNALNPNPPNQSFIFQSKYKG